MDYINSDQHRIEKTISFLKKHISNDSNILDLGIENNVSNQLKSNGFKVTNTKGEDLDLDTSSVEKAGYDVVTSFEIFEHMLCPFHLLRNIKADKLVVSVPLKLWFTDAYWNEKDDRDRHYHEFEPKQLEMLLEKSGWKIVDSEKWASRLSKLGIRPLLRRFVPRYYILYCERK